jgi:hypothetical protein
MKKLAEATVVLEAAALVISFVVALAMIGGCVMPLGPGAATAPVAAKRATT